MCMYVCTFPPPAACVTRKHNPCSGQGQAAGWLIPGNGASAAEDGEQPDGAGHSSEHPWVRIPVLWPALALAARSSALCNCSRDVAANGGPRPGREELPTAIPSKAKGAGAEAAGPRGGKPSQKAEAVALPPAGLGAARGCPDAEQVRRPVPVPTGELPPRSAGRGHGSRRGVQRPAQPGRAQLAVSLPGRGCPGEGAQPGASEPPRSQGTWGGSSGGKSWEVWGIAHFAGRQEGSISLQEIKIKFKKPRRVLSAPVLPPASGSAPQPASPGTAGP